jgi:hypothetical protein
VKRPVGTSPLRGALLTESKLQNNVTDGLAAMKPNDRACVDEQLRSSFADSIDIDTFFQPEYSHKNRWDYLLGHTQTGHIIAVEPHSAKNDEVSTVISKRREAREQLRPHLRDGVTIAAWLWVASGSVYLMPMDKQILRLSQNGITFVGRRVLAKHIPMRVEPPSALTTKRRGK